MYIITDKDSNAIFEWDTVLDYMSNGYPRLTNKDIAFSNSMVRVCKFDGDIPVEVVPVKYCFSENIGFYENPNYIEPQPPQMWLDGYDQAVLDLIEQGVL